MSRPELVVHAGSPKTGSSTLQYSLNQSRQTLWESGIWLPPYFSRQLSHKIIPMACFTRSEFHDTPFANPPGQTISWSSVQAKEKAARAILGVGSRIKSWRKIVLTAEIFSRLTNKDQLVRLRRILSVIPRHKLSLMVYVRNPESYYIARFLQDAKARGREVLLGSLDPLDHIVNFLHAWKTVFGGPIRVRQYGRDLDSQWDIVRDFSRSALEGVELNSHSIPWRRENVSISVEATSLITQFRARNFPEIPSWVRPRSLFNYALKVQEVERQMGRAPRPRLREDARRAVWAASANSVEILAETFGVDLMDDFRFPNGFDIQPTLVTSPSLDQVFELDGDYRALLAYRVASV